MMSAAIKGYYDGNQIVVNEDERKNLSAGDEVIITILNRADKKRDEIKVEKRKSLIEWDSFAISSGRTAEEIDQYIRELRG
ncbi:hypothetical protein VV089_02200 [Candidatus Merdisoma sp. JLR.KK011]|uniref:hypothetical protein n=1 Tax=Candidatus Merdisoma sp. JLR.KK011 TaxID=3114299 RepID=UPI002FF089B3